MSRRVLFSLGILVAAAALLSWRIFSFGTSSEFLSERKLVPIPVAPLCPWRDPEGDLRKLFSTATRFESDTLILSGLRAEMAARLGRTPTGDENALHLYRIYEGPTALGWVVPRRVKGRFGAIELVLAIGTDGKMRALQLQRMREPEPVARALQDASWLGAFVGKGANDAWQFGGDIPAVAAEAHESAQAIIQGTRTCLVLLDAFERARPGEAPITPHH